MSPTSPFVLGIAGGTASGKTTIARLFAERLGERALLIHHDRYYLPLPEHLRANPTAHNFDHPDALDTPRLIDDLARLRAGHPADVPDYLFSEMRRADAFERLHPRPVIIVEGILVLADPRLRGLFDASAYVHTPDDIRLIRRIRRDVAERSRDVEHVLAQYEATVRPMHEAFVAPSRGHAQLVLDGLADPTVSEARLLQLLPRR